MKVIRTTAPQTVITPAVAASGRATTSPALAPLARDARALAAQQRIADLKAFAPTGESWEGWRSFEVIRRIDEADNQVSFDMRAADGQPIPGYKAGQFLHVKVQIGSEWFVRHYSLSDSPKDDFYRITIKRALPPEGSEFPPGKVSTHFLDSVQVGALIDVRAPKGRFTLDPASTTPVVMIAGGIGVAPFLSMVKDLADQNSTRPVTLYYACSSATEFVRRDDLRAIAAIHPNIKLHLIVSRAKPGDKPGDYDRVGRINMDLLKQTLPEGTYEFYLCGPNGMMADMTAAFRAAGVSDQYIHTESFGSHRPKPPMSHPPTASERMSAPRVKPIELTFVGTGKAAWSPSTGRLVDVPATVNIEVDTRGHISVPLASD